MDDPLGSTKKISFAFHGFQKGFLLIQNQSSMSMDDPYIKLSLLINFVISCLQGVRDCVYPNPDSTNAWTWGPWNPWSRSDALETCRSSYAANTLPCAETENLFLRAANSVSGRILGAKELWPYLGFLGPSTCSVRIIRWVVEAMSVFLIRPLRGKKTAKR